VTPHGQQQAHELQDRGKKREREPGEHHGEGPQGFRAREAEETGSRASQAPAVRDGGTLQDDRRGFGRRRRNPSGRAEAFGIAGWLRTVCGS
jgi:hypothetical protein